MRVEFHWPGSTLPSLPNYFLNGHSPHRYWRGRFFEQLYVAVIALIKREFINRNAFVCVGKFNIQHIPYHHVHNPHSFWTFHTINRKIFTILQNGRWSVIIKVKVLSCKQLQIYISDLYFPAFGWNQWCPGHHTNLDTCEIIYDSEE
jgi:hypothetical protein